jgi:glutamine synthetase
MEAVRVGGGSTPRRDGAGPAVGPGSSPLGHKLRPKEGYFLVPPADALQDVRTSMVTLLERVGVSIRLLRGFPTSCLRRPPAV